MGCCPLCPVDIGSFLAFSSLSLTTPASAFGLLFVYISMAQCSNTNHHTPPPQNGSNAPTVTKWVVAHCVLLTLDHCFCIWFIVHLHQHGTMFKHQPPPSTTTEWF